MDGQQYPRVYSKNQVRNLKNNRLIKVYVNYLRQGQFMKSLSRKKIVCEIQELIESSKSDDWKHVMEMLLEIGSRMGPEEGDHLIDNYPNLLEYHNIAAKHYETYILKAEDEEVNKLLQTINGNVFNFTNFAGLFGKQAYDRVNDMFNYIDFSSCQRFVLVGCGALPVTIFQVHDNTTTPDIIGLDIRTEAIETLEMIVEKFDLKRVQPIQCSGQEFDYNDVDVVYIANLVTPKEQVLERIATTASKNVQIIMRDPYSIGRLWTEHGTEKLDSKFEIIAYGKPGPAYFSRDVFLRIAD